jgi:hypothetical protein
MTRPEEIAHLLAPDEQVEVVANARAAKVFVTNRHLAVADGHRVSLHVAFPALRRIQFDIERDRPATLVIVPESPHDEPQVLAVQAADYDQVAKAIAAIGRRLAESA